MSSSESSDNANGRSVLLVEDIDEHRYLYAHVLRIAGYVVHEAGDGVQATTLARSERLDAVVLDIGVPGIDGWQVLRLLRANPTTAKTPVIVVTVHCFEDDQRRARELGCEYLLPKPTSPIELLAVVDNVLGIERPSLSGVPVSMPGWLSPDDERSF